MGGGLLQLTVEGSQETYLTSNPQISFFKIAYHRHTNFSIEAIQQQFNSEVDFGKRITCGLSRNGDLISRLYLQTRLPSLENAPDPLMPPVPPLVGYHKWAHKVGLALIKSVDLEIGGQQIDKQYGDWMCIWNDLSLAPGKKEGYQKMTGYEIPIEGDNAVNTKNIPEMNLFIPIEFWFCRNPGLALPLIALQYNDIRINIELRKLSELHRHGTDPIPSHKVLGPTSLWVDYIFLDSEERRRFAQMSHEYLIEQIQFSGEEKSSSEIVQVKLNFNHYVKELVWVSQYGTFMQQNQWFNYTDTYDHKEVTARNIVTTGKLLINGADRFSERSGEYFNLVQPYQHHTNIPFSQGINVYSFALYPEETQPSGSLNFSRLDTATLNLTVNLGGNLTTPLFDLEPPRPSSYISHTRVYAVNYNVMRISSGMAGLMYST